MKKFILFTSILVFLATTFESDSPPGWYQQTIPLGGRLINDIYFQDSLTGWVVTDATDSATVYKTINGGNNWSVQFRQNAVFNAVQFLDYNTGYVVGGTGTGRVYKTTNGGTNWVNTSSFASQLKEVFFTSKDTGWVCDDNPLDGGVFKTTNGGLNWQGQLGATFFIRELFMLNNDTGWALKTSTNARLYKTTNSGINWNLQYTFSDGLACIFFYNKDTAWVTGAGGTNRTTDGGFTWTLISTTGGGFNMDFVSNQIGYGGNTGNIINKTTNGGVNWFAQPSPIFNNSVIEMLDVNKGWAGGNGIVKTTDGGGPVGINQLSTEVPLSYELYQNYPNPFNPTTNIKYSIKRAEDVMLVIYDIAGKKVAVLINQKQSAGSYDLDWDASGFSSGIYFYSLIIDGRTADTKKMVLAK